MDIKKNSLLENFAIWMVVLITFAIPIEHKYDKFLRFFSLKVIPSGVSLPPGYNPKIYIYGSDVLALTLFVLSIFAFRTSLRTFFLEKGAFFLWILFASAVFSLFLSPFATYIGAYIRLLQLMTPFILYSFLANRNLNLSPFFYALVFAGTIQATFAIAQYFSQESLGLRLLSESRGAPSIFPIESGKLWLLGSEGVSNIIRRARGTLPHSNILGGFLAVSILATYALIVKKKRPLILSVALFLQFFALNTSFSRSAIFGVFIATILWFFWAVSQKKGSYRYLGSLIACSVLVSTLLLFEQSYERGGLLNYNQTSRNADQERIEAQTTAVEMIRKNPLTGVGYEQFSRLSSIQEQKQIPAHNIFLFVFGELGLIGFLSLIGFSLFVVFQGYKSPFSPEVASLFGAFIALLFIGICDLYPITSQQGKLLFFLTGALLVSKAQEKNAQLANI